MRSQAGRDGENIPEYPSAFFVSSALGTAMPSRAPAGSFGAFTPCSEQGAAHLLERRWLDAVALGFLHDPVGTAASDLDGPRSMEAPGDEQIPRHRLLRPHEEGERALRACC
jgi:hypothetical protein